MTDTPKIEFTFGLNDPKLDDEEKVKMMLKNFVKNYQPKQANNIDCLARLNGNTLVEQEVKENGVLAMMKAS